MFFHETQLFEVMVKVNVVVLVVTTRFPDVLLLVIVFLTSKREGGSDWLDFSSFGVS